jgi:hypothetical protein
MAASADAEFARAGINGASERLDRAGLGEGEKNLAALRRHRRLNPRVKPAKRELDGSRTNSSASALAPEASRSCASTLRMD